MRVRTFKDVIDNEPEESDNNSELGRRFGVHRATIRKYRENPEKVLVVGDELFPSSKAFPSGRKRKDS
ncbi:hypothetical protein VPGG_00010 [Vibrio phage VBM1]|uniref:hypothetical protein n=1 Tax=Vibrio phage VBM1 TaxID=754074 RepID=UPI0002C06B75|nr:hypothetical protein VPGG_00010 [Vibrio phage VBM1]AGH07327.1 hypothetical protein VPGG_00010 [Vibrio phage VBM1]